MRILQGQILSPGTSRAAGSKQKEILPWKKGKYNVEKLQEYESKNQNCLIC